MRRICALVERFLGLCSRVVSVPTSKTYLGRKISRDKWVAHPGLEEGEVAADLVTGKARELRTTDNALSFYQSVDSADEAIERTALAFAAISERIEPLSVAWIDAKVLKHAQVRLTPSEGKTYVEDLRSHHVDAEHLDAVRLGAVAAALGIAIFRKDQVRDFTKEDVAQLLKSAVKTDRLHPASIKPNLRQELERRIADDH